MHCGCKPYNPLSDRYMVEDAAGRRPDGEYIRPVTKNTRKSLKRLDSENINFQEDFPQ
jgi:hypothetical protein